MIGYFTLFNLLSAESQNPMHSKLVLSLLIANSVLNNGLYSAIDGNRHWFMGLQHAIDHIAGVRLQVTNGLNVRKIHTVLRQNWYGDDSPA